MNLPLMFNPTVVFVDCAAMASVKLMMKTSCLDGEKIIKKINVSCLIVPIFLQKSHNWLITQDYAICLIFQREIQNIQT